MVKTQCNGNKTIFSAARLFAGGAAFLAVFQRMVRLGSGWTMPDFGERRSQAATGIKQGDGNLPYG